VETGTVIHPQLGPGRLLKTYIGGFEWEVEFEQWLAPFLAELLVLIQQARQSSL
jgi:hypothetical protein